MYLNDYLYICIYTYLDRQSCRFFFATFEFHITLVLFHGITFIMITAI